MYHSLMRESDELEDRMWLGDTVDSMTFNFASSETETSIKFKQPIIVRKEFPETWIWENINEPGFVKFFKIVVLALCCKVVLFNSFMCSLFTLRLNPLIKTIFYLITNR